MDLSLGLQSTLHFFNSGGIVMYPLLVLSIIVIGIAIERFMYFRNNMISSKQLSEISSALHKGNFSQAEELCEAHPSVVTRTLATGLANSDCATALKNSLEERMTMELTSLNCHMDYLSAIVTVAPLLGLLGTVTGMISTFSILDSGLGATAITGGIGEALIATASGLCVAIIAFGVYTYFSHRVNSVITTTEELATQMMESKRNQWRKANV